MTVHLFLVFLIHWNVILALSSEGRSVQTYINLKMWSIFPTLPTLSPVLSEPPVLILEHKLSFIFFLFFHFSPDDSSSRNVFALQLDFNHSTHILPSHRAVFQEFHVPPIPPPQIKLNYSLSSVLQQCFLLVCIVDYIVIIYLQVCLFFWTVDSSKKAQYLPYFGVSAYVNA